MSRPFRSMGGGSHIPFFWRESSVCPLPPMPCFSSFVVDGGGQMGSMHERISPCFSPFDAGPFLHVCPFPGNALFHSALWWWLPLFFLSWRNRRPHSDL